jgi:hypothetical protein
MRALLGYRHSSAVGHVVNVARRIMARRFLKGLPS